jgi:alcohol dehydrogenase class IV
VPSTFSTVRTVVTGAGSVSELGAVARVLGRRATVRTARARDLRALVVTGGGSLEKAGVLERARESLRAAGVEFDEHPGVLPEPDLATVELLRGRLHECFDIVVSIGGGSVIDAAKAAAALVAEDAPVREFHGVRGIETEGLPHVAVPTTAGTGAEVTPNAVITDPERPRKASIRGPTLLPAAAVVDPELLVGLPARLTAESGMDALVQAIESYVSVHATPLTEGLSLHAITLLARGLVAAVEHGSDIEARAACAYGSLCAGMALANARLGVVHGLAHPLGARLHLAHGEVCAMLLAPSIRLNDTPDAGSVARAKYVDVAHRLADGLSHAGTDGLTVAGMTREEVARRTPSAQELVECIMERLDLPRKLPEDAAAKLGVDAGDETVEKIVEESMSSGSLKANPLRIEPEHVRSLLAEIMPRE